MTRSFSGVFSLFRLIDVLASAGVQESGRLGEAGCGQAAGGRRRVPLGSFALSRLPPPRDFRILGYSDIFPCVFLLAFAARLQIGPSEVSAATV